MFTLAISPLTTSNLPWFMDLTFQVPMQYCSLHYWTLLPSTFTSLSLSLHSSGDFSPLFFSSILGNYWPGVFIIFQYHIFLLFHTIHMVLTVRILKWFAIPFSSRPRFVRTLHHDLSVLDGPTQHGLWFHWVRQSVIHVISWLTFCDCGFHPVCSLVDKRLVFLPLIWSFKWK